MDARRLITIGIAAVVGAGLLLVLTLVLARNPDVKKNLVDDVFTVGNADSLAEEVDRRGPLLFQDPGGKRNLLVDHLSDEKWLAYTTSIAKGCELELDRASGDVRNSCTHAVVVVRSTAAVRKIGSTPYPATVNDDGELVVDLRFPADVEG